MKDEAFLSEADKKDILFGIKNGVDFVAASFVSTKQDVQDLRDFLNANGGEDIEIVAKIENRASVDNIEGICELADGIMQFTMEHQQLCCRVKRHLENIQWKRLPLWQLQLNKQKKILIIIKNLKTQILKLRIH